MEAAAAPSRTFLEMNRKITSAYAEMYLQNPDVFKWAGMAALGTAPVVPDARQTRTTARPATHRRDPART